MVLRKGNIWFVKYGVRVFTGNASINSHGELVMGRGLALQTKQRYPGCAKVFGRLIKEHSSQYPYGILIHPDRTDPILAVAQVKYQYWDKADLELIQYSMHHLAVLANTDWSKHQVCINFPGIGWGGRKREEVLPILDELPDNVDVWEYKT